MTSLTSRDLVTCRFSWKYYYWFLTEAGIECAAPFPSPPLLALPSNSPRLPAAHFALALRSAVLATLLLCIPACYNATTLITIRVGCRAMPCCDAGTSGNTCTCRLTRCPTRSRRPPRPAAPPLRLAAKVATGRRAARAALGVRDARATAARAAARRAALAVVVVHPVLRRKLSGLLLRTMLLRRVSPPPARAPRDAKGQTRSSCIPCAHRCGLFNRSTRCCCSPLTHRCARTGR